MLGDKNYRRRSSRETDEGESVELLAYVEQLKQR